MADGDLHISLDELRTVYTAPTVADIGDYWARHAAAPEESGPDPYPAAVEGVGQGWVFVDVEHHRLWLAFLDNDDSVVQAQNRLFRLDPASDVDESAAIRSLFPDVVTRNDVFDDVPVLLLLRRTSKQETASLLSQLDLDDDGRIMLGRDLPMWVDGAFLPYLMQHGWSAFDLEFLRWSVTTEEDAAALAAHPHEWWQERGWLQSAFDDSKSHPPARWLTDLIAAGIRPEVAIPALYAGMEDIAEIAALRPPVVPADATRIIIGKSVFADPAAAQTALDAHPPWWLLPVKVENDPTLHVFHSDWRYSAWSDGSLLGALADEPEHDNGPTTAARMALSEVNELMSEILRSDGRADLDGTALWVRWAGATGAEATTVETRTAIRQVQTAPDVHIAVIDSLVLHTVRKSGRETVEAWQIRTDYEKRYTIPFVGESRGGTRFYASAEAAADAWARLERTLPAVMTVDELAEHAGVRKSAFDRALRRSWNGPTPVIETDDRRRWYDPVPALAWHRGRPGHGPGRGRRGGDSS